MHRKHLKTTATALFGAAMWLTGGVVGTAQASENEWEICQKQASSKEQARDIPARLLEAVALAESGRWHADKRENIAWPWTVTSRGRGRFFDTKEEAVMEVELLLTDGVRNIDVGCMQINLSYHESAFETLAEAFDPERNAAYAADFLKKLYGITGDWAEAAARYHSATPSKKAPYKAKVVRFWSKLTGNTMLAASQAETEARPQGEALPQAPLQSSPNYVDYARMDNLNQAFRTRRGELAKLDNQVASTNVAAERRHRELDSWRRAQMQGLDMKHLLAMRRAEQELRRKKRLANLGKRDFSDTRRQQLDEWRQRGLWAGS